MKRPASSRLSFTTAATLAAGLVLSSCADVPTEGEFPQSRRSGESHGYVKRDSVFGDEGLSLFSTGDQDSPGGGGAGGGIGVNGYLWRATLDTVSFMPVNSADPFGGVVITDWYTPPETPNERFKMNVYILGRSLRADGVRVAVFRQVDSGAGNWRDAPLPDGTETRIEDAILTKARQLRFDVLQE